LASPRSSLPAEEPSPPPMADFAGSIGSAESPPLEEVRSAYASVYSAMCVGAWARKSPEMEACALCPSRRGSSQHGRSRASLLRAPPRGLARPGRASLSQRFGHLAGWCTGLRSCCRPGGSRRFEESPDRLGGHRGGSFPAHCTVPFTRLRKLWHWKHTRNGTCEPITGQLTTSFFRADILLALSTPFSPSVYSGGILGGFSASMTSTRYLGSPAMVHGVRTQVLYSPPALARRGSIRILPRRIQAQGHQEGGLGQAGPIGRRGERRRPLPHGVHTLDSAGREAGPRPLEVRRPRCHPRLGRVDGRRPAA